MISPLSRKPLTPSIPLSHRGGEGDFEICSLLPWWEKGWG
jgi:hypothetical protein